MRRTVVDDCWGDRWSVRARYDRHVEMESEYTRRNREPLLQQQLASALAPQPEAALEPTPQAFRDAAAARYLSAALVGVQAATGHGVIGALIAIVRGIKVLTEPADRFWVVELFARGRIRRGATWRVPDRMEAERVAAEVAEAVRVGEVPARTGAMLIDVVDERLTVCGTPR